MNQSFRSRLPQQLEHLIGREILKKINSNKGSELEMNINQTAKSRKEMRKCELKYEWSFVYGAYK